MKRDPEVLDRNIGLLLRHAYVPALPAPDFRRRLLSTLEIETRRLVREREPITTLPGPSRTGWRRVAALVATAAAVALLAFGALHTLRDEGAALERGDLLARGDVALRLGEEDWRAAGPEELAHGFVLDADPLWVETPATRPFAIATSAGQVDIVQAAAEAEGLERIFLASGRAAYAGPAGVIELEAGETLRLVDGIPDLAAVALVEPDVVENRQPVEDPPILLDDTRSAEGLATLFGGVETTDGDPLAMFRVGLLRERIGNDYGNTVTRDFENGVFVWKDIRPGKYRVYVHAEGHALLDLGFMTLADEHGIDARLLTGGIVRGHVIDEATGNPVPGALVLSEEDAPQDGLLLSPGADEVQWLPTSARTLADGSFEIAGVSPGAHTLRAGAEGYGATWVQDVLVSDGSVTDGVTVMLASGGAVAGRVTNADGSPRVGEQIIVTLMTADPQEHMQFTPARTDVEGRYHVEDLPAQVMLVVLVDARDGVRPDVRSVDIRSDETAVVDFLGGAVGTRVFGRVLDHEGQPIAHHNMALYVGSSNWAQLMDDFKATTTEADGSFVFEGMAPGEYLAYLADDMGRWIRLVDQFEVPAWPELERIIHVAELEVAGKITDGGNGEPSANCGVILELLDGGQSVFAGNSVSDEHGRFRFGLLNAGRYRVTAYPVTRGLGFVKSDAVVVDETSRAAEVELALPSGAPVEVVVVDTAGRPLAGAAVLFVDESNDGYTVAQLPITDARGSFTAVGVRTGEYKVVASLPGYEGPPVLFRCRVNENNRVVVELTPVASPNSAGEER